MDHRQRKSSGHSSIHSIASLAHDLSTGFGSFLVDADHHRLPGMDRPKSLCVARLANCHTEDNYLENQKFTQSFHRVAASANWCVLNYLILPPRQGLTWA